jgi:hypothetical protein
MDIIYISLSTLFISSSITDFVYFIEKVYRVLDLCKLRDEKKFFQFQTGENNFISRLVK